jgi:hypothetical protein
MEERQKYAPCRNTLSAMKAGETDYSVLILSERMIQ